MKHTLRFLGVAFLLALALAACAEVTFGDENLTLEEMQATAAVVFEEAASTANPLPPTETAILPPMETATADSSPTLVLPPGPAATDPILGALEPTATVALLEVTPEPSSTPVLPLFWEVYFTEPRRPGAGDEIVARLVALIDSARSYIHVAAFEFNLDPLVDALIAARNRGVQVIWITDNEHGLAADLEEGRGQFARLREAGIPVLADTRAGLMHNKFWVFDGGTVWTGSTNATINDTQANNNNVIVLHSPAVAAIYEREFQEMLAGQFGPRSPSTSPDQWAVVESVPVQVFFGPEDNVMSELSRLVDGAQQSIRFMAFSFTYEPLGLIMRIQAGGGLDVAGIFESLGSKTQYSELRAFLCVGVPARVDGNPRLLHHKVVIIDETIVATGSFNFSANADQNNDENLLIIASPEIARLYLEEFNRRWEEARPQEPGLDYTCD
jgi:phosphatidylserine/phosphatidylglycerophosphate/cardiolipin synthase-like enzyme